MQTLLSHARRVLSTRNAERDQRVDIVLSPHLRRRLGNDLTTRYEALVAIAATAADAIELRRERDLQLARGRPDLAQPLGGRLAVAESTILDLLATVAGAGQQDNDQHTAPRRPGRLKDRADARASELAGIYADGLRAGCASDGDMANYLNARGEPPMGQSSMWTVSQCGNLRRRLTRLGLARLALELGRRAAVREVRTRVRPGSATVTAPTAPQARQPRQLVGG